MKYEIVRMCNTSNESVLSGAIKRLNYLADKGYKVIYVTSSGAVSSAATYDPRVRSSSYAWFETVWTLEKTGVGQ